ncbi:MAG: phosphoribosylformylglycinamidine cyclo-ligase [Dehalococcoidia bacterium]
MTAPSDRPLSYAAAGVDIAAADATVARYRAIAARTVQPQVMGGVGPFAGLWRLGAGYRDPVIVSSADGVGTKLRIAIAAGRYDTVGQDLVNHCVNDILTTGAKPLFFLDYLATADLPQELRAEVVAGMGKACEEHEMTLIGGETADMPDMYEPGDFDVAGFIVGVVEHDEVIDGTKIAPGDALIALPSTGLHTNAYSLVRSAFGIAKGGDPAHDRAVLDERPEELAGASLGEALLAVHRSYFREIYPLRPLLHGWAHITGGGIVGNLPRIFRDGIGAELDGASWTVPPLFRLIQRAGNVEDAEMFRACNMGVGAVLVVAEADAARVLAAVEGAWRIGTIIERRPGDPAVRGLPA